MQGHEELPGRRGASLRPAQGAWALPRWLGMVPERGANRQQGVVARRAAGSQAGAVVVSGESWVSWGWGPGPTRPHVPLSLT